MSRICALVIIAILPKFVCAEDKPNILFIAIDDQNDWIGCLGGHPLVKTPHIDRLAQRGTVFLNAHCQAPLCNPSRTSVMTGLRPSTTGIYGLAPWFRTVEAFAEHETLPQYLARHGYRTYTAGKIYHGPFGRRKADNEFHEIGPGPSIGPQPDKRLVDVPSDHPLVDWGVFPHEDQDKGDWKVARWAINQLDAEPQQPFLLSVGFFLPHVPCYATQKWFDLYPEDPSILPTIRKDDRDDTPRFSWYLHWKLPEPRLKYLQESNQWINLVRSYLACTSFVDDQVGRLLDALDRKGLTDNTIVVLWSDHGWHLGEKGITGKNTLWDRSTRVPLIFAGPGIAKRGRCQQPAELLDIYPTLLQLCELPANRALEGHSLSPQLEDASASRDWPAITTCNHDNHGVRSTDWRYIRYADGSEELYSLRADPNEFDNLIDDDRHRDVLQQHRNWLPKTSAKPAPGSRECVLIYREGKANWEGADIRPGDPIPEL